MTSRARRIAAWLSGLWAGLLVAIGAIAAPAAFAITLPETAGRIAGRMFAQEAYLSLALSIGLFLVLRGEARAAARQGAGSLFSTDMLLALGALFCTVAGYFTVVPMMAAARGGGSALPVGLSFGALHGISAGFFALKGLLVLALAWRLGAPRA